MDPEDEEVSTRLRAPKWCGCGSEGPFDGARPGEAYFCEGTASCIRLAADIPVQQQVDPKLEDKVHGLGGEARLQVRDEDDSERMVRGADPICTMHGCIHQEHWRTIKELQWKIRELEEKIKNNE